jgi:hypothetical protein
MVIKGAEALIVICIILWGFWMSKEWLTKDKKNKS